MGNGASTSQGSIPSHDRRDVRTSNVKEQHDWQEQAVAPKQEIQSLPDGRKPYIILASTYMDVERISGTNQ